MQEPEAERKRRGSYCDSRRDNPEAQQCQGRLVVKALEQTPRRRETKRPAIAGINRITHTIRRSTQTAPAPWPIAPFIQLTSVDYSPESLIRRLPSPGTHG
jgi:hypothetical protein